MNALTVLQIAALIHVVTVWWPAIVATLPIVYLVGFSAYYRYRGHHPRYWHSFHGKPYSHSQHDGRQWIGFTEPNHDVTEV